MDRDRKMSPIQCMSDGQGQEDEFNSVYVEGGAAAAAAQGQADCEAGEEEGV